MINSKVKKSLDQLEQIIAHLESIVKETENQSISDEVSQLSRAIKEPFLFVIVGEVKAGKSSFINALLESKEPIVEVAPEPKTDKVNQLLYDEDERSVDINAHFRKIYKNHPILKEISIVDTPGTNTIIEYHQEITERFIPIADLVLFVFEAKNPYRQSSWDFLSLLHDDLHKNIIFVLQQSDLLSKEDLETNKSQLTAKLLEKGYINPVIFSLSAKKELEDGTGSFQELRSYIEENITGGKSYQLKAASIVQSIENVIVIFSGGLKDRSRQLELDQEFRSGISEKIDKDISTSRTHAQLLSENLRFSFKEVSARYESDIKQTLSFWGLLKRSLGSIFSKQQNLQTWSEDLKKSIAQDLENNLQYKIEEGVQQISNSLVDLSEWMDLQIKQSNTILTNDHEVFANIARRRKQVMNDIRQQFDQWVTSGDVAFEPIKDKLNTSLPSQVATGSGMALIGVVLAAVTKLMVFDITGGVLTGIGLLFAGISSGYNRSKILKNYRQASQEGAEKIEQKTQVMLVTYLTDLKMRLEDIFSKLDDHLILEKKKVEKSEQELRAIKIDLSEVKKSIS
jgi:small GTP-binding protein